jgi:hypothetical protein
MVMTRGSMRGPCDRLDAASIPACDDQRLDPALADPRDAGPRPEMQAPAAPAPPVANAVPPPVMAPPRPRCSPTPGPSVPGGPCKSPAGAKSPGGFWREAMKVIGAHPLLTGGGAGLAVLLTAILAWWLAVRLRGPRVGAPRPPATRPTAYRRDLMLTDEGRREWRIPGAALTPGALIGAGAKATLRLEGEGIAARHVQVWVTDGRLRLRKIGADPVFLNDRLLRDATPEIVSTGDQLRLGLTAFTVTVV